MQIPLLPVGCALQTICNVDSATAVFYLPTAPESLFSINGIRSRRHTRRSCRTAAPIFTFDHFERLTN